MGFLAFSQVLPIDTVIARALVDAMVLFVVVNILVIVSSNTDYGTLPQAPLAILAVLLVALLGATGFGLCLAAACLSVPAIHEIMSAVWRLVFFTSGIFFTLSQFPEEFVIFVIWNPVLHVTETIRSFFFGIDPHPAISMIYPILFSLIAMLLGLLLERMVRRRSKVR